MLELPHSQYFSRAWTCLFSMQAKTRLGRLLETLLLTIGQQRLASLDNESQTSAELSTTIKPSRLLLN